MSHEDDARIYPLEKSEVAGARTVGEPDGEINVLKFSRSGRPESRPPETSA